MSRDRHRTHQAGLGRNCAHCLATAAARERIRQACRDAVRHASQRQPWKPALPIELELTLYRSDYAAEVAAGRPDVGRVDARTLRRTVASAAQACAF